MLIFPVGVDHVHFGPPVMHQRFIDAQALRDRVHVFRDRAHAGEELARLLEPYANSSALVCAIPAGGVPVAVAIAERLKLELDLVVVSKVTLPWNTEVGYGAVAFDGSVLLNDDLVARAGLTADQVREGIAKTTAKVQSRAERLRKSREPPAVSGRTAIIVDDGLASGFTLRVAIRALAAAQERIVAVPTAHYENARAIAAEVDGFYCANLRRGRSFAVADAYEHWSDVSEEELAALVGDREQ